MRSPEHIEVYPWCMARTNIEIDDTLVAEAMTRFDVKTKREAVDLALRRLVGVPLTKDRLLALRGTGYESDLAEIRPAHDPWGGV